MVAFRDGRRSTPKDQAAYEAKLNTLAATIATAAPDVLAVHLKSKLLTFPDGRFNPTEEDERARFAAYALNRRIAEAATAREAATTQLLYGPPCSRYGTGGFSHPDHGDGQRLWNLAPQIPPGHPILPHLRGTTGTDRPHPDQPRLAADPPAVRGHPTEPGC